MLRKPDNCLYSLCNYSLMTKLPKNEMLALLASQEAEIRRVAV
jgi:hypothetical protein